MARIPDSYSSSFDGAVPGCHRDLLLDFTRIEKLKVRLFLSTISLELKLLYIVPRDGMPTVTDMVPVLPAKGATHQSLQQSLAHNAKAETELDPVRIFQ
jgi:hypothetical protein